MTLFPDQEDAAAVIEDFLATAGPSSVFTVHGLAGTGKTHLLAEMARRHSGVLMVAPTGKAATVLRARSGFFVSTIHSAIYNFRGLVDDQRRPDYKVPVFSQRAETDIGNVVFLDECSMVGNTLATHLLDTGVSVVAFGDPGQLAPVGDKPFFTVPDITLKTIRRQALESPIIRQAHRVRHGEAYEADGDFRVLPIGTKRDVFLRAVFQADIALCYLNTTRLYLNSLKRSLLRRTGPLQPGEPIMCLRNSDVPWGKLCNGEIAYVVRPQEPSDLGIWVAVESGAGVQGPYHLPQAVFEGDDNFRALQYEEDVVPFALAYAATVHKSQGSEWPHVLLLDEYDRRSEKREFLYTGITRAVKEITVVRCLR
jgi:exodeoxyribonuclease-5